MRRLILCLCLVWLGAGCSTPNTANLREEGGDVYGANEIGEFVKDTQPISSSDQYIIGVGDRLDVTFFYHPDVTTKDLLVRNDGRITLPYLGDVVAAGYSPMQLDTLLTQQFSEILKEPNISVILREAADPMVFVLGQVKKPGGYIFRRYLSLSQAIALAGGTSRGAHTREVLVLRRDGVHSIVGVQIDLQGILNGESIQDDLPLRNMDLVFVPKTALESSSEVMQALTEVISPFTEVLQTTWVVFLLNDRLRD
jgi:polysaccharide export outer membrane protein